ncbi:MAG: DUF680 domain-containing protein [Mesorhizobium sp.]|nr:MAG: DUF680 domain-containing protein [Mesorhizobium sp.]
MTRIVLTAAAIFVATGSAFAGSDHYGSDNANHPAALLPMSTTRSWLPSAGRPWVGMTASTPGS